MAERGFIYKYTFPNGKVYIGQTKVSVKVRHYQHMSASRDPQRRTLCEVAIAKYGEPQCETIETIEVGDHEFSKLSNLLDEAEKKWIRHYDSTTASGKGYNVHEGGKILEPRELLLQERWYEIYNNDGWEEGIAYVRYLLESIGTKLCITKEKLTKEERSIWYGYKFHEYYFKEEGVETTFYSFYRRHVNDSLMCNIGDIPYDILKVLNDENSSKEDKERAMKEHDKCIFNTVLNVAVKEHWIEDIRQTIWKQVMKEKKQILHKFSHTNK